MAISKTYRICDAYEAGFGTGIEGKLDYKNPCKSGTEEYEAWDIGFEKGKEKFNEIKDGGLEESCINCTEGISWAFILKGIKEFNEKYKTNDVPDANDPPPSDFLMKSLTQARLLNIINKEFPELFKFMLNAFFRPPEKSIDGKNE